jgi:hypothetical protein
MVLVGVLVVLLKELGELIIHDDIYLCDCCILRQKAGIESRLQRTRMSMKNINSFRGFTDTIRPSPFRYLDVVHEEHQ